MAARKVVKTVISLIAVTVAAIGMGMYVYPQRPWLVWALLMFCWLCYRLKMRADALFGPHKQSAKDGMGSGSADDLYASSSAADGHTV